MRGLGLFVGMRRRPPVAEVGGDEWDTDFQNPDRSGLLAALMIGA
jgi:hypothetical protein